MLESTGSYTSWWLRFSYYLPLLYLYLSLRSHLCVTPRRSLVTSWLRKKQARLGLWMNWLDMLVSQRNDTCPKLPNQQWALRGMKREVAHGYNIYKLLGSDKWLGWLACKEKVEKLRTRRSGVKACAWTCRSKHTLYNDFESHFNSHQKALIDW